MIKKEEAINRYRAEYPNSYNYLDDQQAYAAAIQRYKGEEIEQWDEAYKRFNISIDPKTGEDRTSPGYVNSLWELADYGVDENSSNWLKQSYNYSLTSKTQEILTGKPKYDLEGYPPGFWEDIFATTVSFLYPADIIAMMAGGAIGKGAYAVGSKVGLLPMASKKAVEMGLTPKVYGKVLEGMFSSAGTLGLYEGAMGGTQAAIEGKDTSDVLSAAGDGVMHGGVMGAAIGLVGGGMGAKHASLKALGKEKTLSTAQKALYGATSLPSVVAAEATVFSASQMKDIIDNGIIDDDGSVRDPRLKDYLDVWMKNVALIGVLKAQGKIQEKLFSGSEELLRDAREKIMEGTDAKSLEAYRALRQDLYGDKEITKETRAAIDELGIKLEKKGIDSKDTQYKNFDRVKKLGERPFEEIVNNPDLLASRIQYLQMMESLAAEAAKTSTGKDKILHNYLADTARKELNKFNEIMNGGHKHSGTTLEKDRFIVDKEGNIVRESEKAALEAKAGEQVDMFGAEKPTKAKDQVIKEKVETKEPLKVGDTVQWEVQGAWQYETPKKVTDIVEHTDGKKYVFVEGSKSAVPLNQVFKQKIKAKEIIDPIKDTSTKGQEVTELSSTEIPKRGSIKLQYDGSVKTKPLKQPKVGTVESVITGEKFDSKRTRSQLFSDVRAAENASNWITGKNKSTTRKSFFGTDKIQKLSQVRYALGKKSICL